MDDVLVPEPFQRLVEIHGVDAARLRTELTGRVKTRTWPGTDPRRVDLQSLPDLFPRFKGVVVGNRLRIDAMRLTESAVLSVGATFARLEMPMPALPETIIASLGGRRLSEVVGHAAVDGHTSILSAAVGTGGDGTPVLRMELDVGAVPLASRAGARQQAAAPAPDVDALIARTHSLEVAGMRVDERIATDPRTWETALPRVRIVGLRVEPSPHGGDVLALRFPYDRRMARLIAGAGCGAWFDRTNYSWRISSREDALTALTAFLLEHADAVIAPDGRMHIRQVDP